MAQKRMQDLDDYARRLIKCKAHQLIGKYGFTRSDVDDLTSEMTHDLSERMAKYDANIAKRSTFIARVVERKISKIIRHQKTELRDYRRNDCSLNEYMKADNGQMVERVRTISQDEQDLRSGKHSRPKSERVDLQIDLSLIISGLPSDQKQLVDVLTRTDSIAEAARELGVPRTSLYAPIQRLRVLFEDKGLGEYL